MSATSSDPTPFLFISHKHCDSSIADVVRSFITMQSGGRVGVFQSSSPWTDAPKAGRNLNKQLRETLWKTNVVILIYTGSEQDWSYCMWECGVASHPQSPDTRIILFQCSSTFPGLFADQVNVNVRDLVSLQQFVDEFLTTPDFFPGFQKPVTEFQPHGREVASAAADLYQKLEAVLPPEKEDPSIEWPAHPFLQLELSSKLIEQIKKIASKDRSKLGGKTLLKESKISAADKYCEQMFGVPSFPGATTLEELVAIWEEKRPGVEPKWIKALCSQILAGALWQFPPIAWELMQGVNDDVWRVPMLNRVRKIPARQCMQFDIYFYRLDPRAGADLVQIDLPGPAKKGKKPGRTARSKKAEESQPGPAPAKKRKRRAV